LRWAPGREEIRGAELPSLRWATYFNCDPAPGRNRELNRGSGHPLGTTLKRGGAHFIRFPRSATRAELLLFDRAEEARPNRVIELEPGANSWRRWIDTAQETPEDIVPWEQATPVSGLAHRAEARSVVVLYAAC